ncbi:MAG TPA: InlB B-repeat-containing protein, partial [Anaerolineae bacterium]|nr:InlB B-repeat-containing protein [Anaerolineae bacterium]
NKVVTATFTQDEYTLTVNVVGNGAVGKDPDQATYHYGDVVTLTATADPGWTFAGWSGDLSGTANPTSITMNGNKVVTATFTQDEYTLTVNVVGNGAVGKAPDQATYHYGDVVTLTATADPGWYFAGWSGDLSGLLNPQQLLINGDKVVTATFTAQPPVIYTLDVNTVGGGTVTWTPLGTEFVAGTLVTLTATADPGWTFAGWSGDLSGTANPTSITMNSNKVVTATFTQDEYTLTVNVVGNGAVGKAPDQATYHYGDVVTLTATADPGWTFVGWSGDLSGTANPTSITMNGNKVVTATFTQDEYTLMVNVVGSGVVNKDPNRATYRYGDRVSLAAIAALGWTFAGWSGDLSGTANPTSITMNGNKVVTATFVQSCIPVSGVDFDWSPVQPFGGEVVTFQASVLAGTAPFTYTWNIADTSKSGSSVTHTFPLLTTVQSYRVTLTVFNACTPNGVAQEKSITVRPRTIYLPLVMRNVP